MEGCKYQQIIREEPPTPFSTGLPLSSFLTNFASLHCGWRNQTKQSMINGAYTASPNSCTSCQGLHGRQGGQKRTRLQGSHAPPETAMDEQQSQKNIKKKTTNKKKKQTDVNTAVVAHPLEPRVLSWACQPVAGYVLDVQIMQLETWLAADWSAAIE